MNLDDALQIGGIYMHPTGVEYRLDAVLDDITDYETTSQIHIGVRVLYTQLKDRHFSAGKQWIRTTEDFLRVFEFTGRHERKPSESSE